MTIDRAIEILDPETFPDVSGDEAAEACRMGVEALKRQRWIPCSERLPEKGERVMFWAARAGCILTGRFEYKGSMGVVWFDVGCDYSFSGTHWMHLPEPPKKGGTRSEEK